MNLVGKPLSFNHKEVIMSKAKKEIRSDQPKSERIQVEFGKGRIAFRVGKSEYYLDHDDRAIIFLL